MGKMSKPDCYKCEHRRNLIGDAHSTCSHPDIKEKTPIAMALFMAGRKPLGVEAEDHGVQSGWFLWPINFDPVWLRACKGFLEKSK